ncbi:MAG: hypothetical protein WBX50_10430 [Candidatus Deferrimicrobiaceae bacterium]
MEESTSTPGPKVYSRRFGTIAFLRGYVTLEQFQQAFMEQFEDNISGREHRLLGTIFREKNWITEEQEKAILAEMEKYVT